MSRRVGGAPLLVVLVTLVTVGLVTLRSTSPGSGAPPASTSPDVTAPPTAPPTTTAAASPVPLSVTSPRQDDDGQVLIAPGAVVTISGTCDAPGGEPFGPVQIWVVPEVSTSPVDVVRTGIEAVSWSYEWASPVAPTGSITLRAWCGDPAASAGDYPAELQIAVVFVAQIAPPPTTGNTVAPGTVASRPAALLPATE